MLGTTLDVFKAALRSDPTVSASDRNQLLAILRKGLDAPKPEATIERVARLIRRAEVAERMACSLRTVDKLAATGVLKKRKLPGRVRASGFLESDVAALIAGQSQGKAE